ncbi:Putative metal-dependent hydrolase YfiT [Zobellia galactanivorans]|uniref:Putative metal-dependent hydrolase YfiT n=2 Tax=Flavobacteriaceae TaxID=49546 RepID=G0LCK5_ZOBGA|nr:Putative metal-dependent hydrolase YfiT [Zobellia galactanivorans]
MVKNLLKFSIFRSMENNELEALQYPIGKFQRPKEIDHEQIQEWIEVLEKLPNELTLLVEGLTEEQLETPYRPGGWTVRQTIHHIADSHHNSYIRFKWALTEDTPIIKAYDEKAWAKLFDSKTAPVQLALDHLSAVHGRWVYLLKGLGEEQLKRRFVHPDSRVAIALDENIGQYAWHGRHHFAHIYNLMERKGWTR